MLCIACYKRELWKPVVVPSSAEYGNYYSVSNRGQIFRMARVTPYVKNGKHKTRNTPSLILKHTMGYGGYPFIGLKLPGKPQVLFKIASLVAWTFCRGYFDGAHVRHKDDNRAHSCRSNLEFGTHQDNMDDMVIRGRSSKGEKHGLARLSEADVRRIAVLLRTTSLSQKEIAREFNITQANVSQINLGRTWGHITGFNT